GEAPPGQARVLPGGREAAHAVAASREALGRMPAGGTTRDPVARSPALVRVPARHGERSTAAGTGLARTQHDGDDDAVLAPRSWAGRIADSGARKPEFRGNRVATATTLIGKVRRRSRHG